VGVLRTLSKVGFAALRVGWFLGPAALVREVDKVRQPYNLPSPSQRGATFVLRELGTEVERVCAKVVEERQRLARELPALGCEVTESHANFIWLRTRSPSAAVVDALAGRGVLVKNFPRGGERLAHWLRVTVGLPNENDRFLEAMTSCNGA